MNGQTKKRKITGAFTKISRYHLLAVYVSSKSTARQKM